MAKNKWLLAYIFCQGKVSVAMIIPIIRFNALQRKF